MPAKAVAKPQLELEDPMSLIGTIPLGGRQLQPQSPSLTPTPGTLFIPRKTQNRQLTDLLGYGAYDAILDLLPDLSPDVSLATWNMIRLVSRGMDVKVRKLDDSAEDDEGQQLADSVAKQINANQGGIVGMTQTLVYSLYVYGDAALEVLPAVSDNGTIKGVEDWFTASTPSLHASRDRENFQRIVWYQRQYAIGGLIQNKAQGTAGYTRLNPNLFFYSGLDTAPDYPYGRSPIQAVLSHILTDIQLLQDLGAWVHVGVWPHMMAIIDIDILKAITPTATQQDALKWSAWIKSAVADARSLLSGRNPDDTIVVPSYVRLETIKAEAQSGATAAKEAITMVERKIIRALKMLPALMGSNEGTTETHATVQWEVFSATIEALQRALGYLYEQAFAVSLRLLGKAAIVNVTFEQVRASDRYRDAQSLLMEIQAEVTKRDEGWETQDEASIAITGTPAVPAAERYASPVAEAQLKGTIAATQVEIGDPTAETTAPGDNTAENLQPIKPARIRTATATRAPAFAGVKSVASHTIKSYLQNQADDVIAACDDGETDPSVLIDEGYDEDLAGLLAGVYTTAGESAFSHATKSLGKALVFNAAAGNIKSYMDKLPDRAKGINDTQRDGVKRALQTEGDKVDAVKAYYANSLESDAERIATTEAMYSYNNAALSAFDDAGVGMVDITDGDQFDAICAERDGTTVTIEEARDMVANTHPFCQIQIWPSSNSGGDATGEEGDV